MIFHKAKSVVKKERLNGVAEQWLKRFEEA